MRMECFIGKLWEKFELKNFYYTILQHCSFSEYLKCAYVCLSIKDMCVNTSKELLALFIVKLPNAQFLRRVRWQAAVIVINKKMFCFCNASSERSSHQVGVLPTIVRNSKILVITDTTTSKYSPLTSICGVFWIQLWQNMLIFFALIFQRIRKCFRTDWVVKACKGEFKKRVEVEAKAACSQCYQLYISYREKK